MSAVFIGIMMDKNSERSLKRVAAIDSIGPWNVAELWRRPCTPAQLLDEWLSADRYKTWINQPTNTTQPFILPWAGKMSISIGAAVLWRCRCDVSGSWKWKHGCPKQSWLKISSGDRPAYS